MINGFCINELRQQYPEGTRILLDYMDDKYAVPTGTRGTVLHVDDGGNIHMKWDNSRTLTTARLLSHPVT